MYPASWMLFWDEWESQERIYRRSRKPGWTYSSINAYELEVTELQKAEEKLQKYIELNPDVKAGSVPVSEAMSAEELSSKLRSLASILSEKQDLISKYDRELEAAYEEIDTISESEEKLQELESKFEELSEKYKIVEKTQDYLRQAKELFIAKYMSPIKDSFDKYYEIISGSGDTFRIDANVNLTRKEEGGISRYRGAERRLWRCHRYKYETCAT